MIRVGARKLRLLVLNVEKTSRRPDKTIPFAFRTPAYVDGCFQSARASYFFIYFIYYTLKAVRHHIQRGVAKNT